MGIEEITRVYNKYNPISQYVIRPTLKLVDAHNHPLRGGFAAAVSSGLAHYALIEVASRSFDILWGNNITSTQIKPHILAMPLPVHLFVGINMLDNLRVGFVKYVEKELAKEKQRLENTK